MSSICKSFESNAWRNDLCSHCFQSKEEHGLTMTSPDSTKDASTSSSAVGLGSRYQSVLNHSRSSYRTSSSSTTTSSVTSLSAAAPAATMTTAATTPVNPTSANSHHGVKAILKNSGHNSSNKQNGTKHTKSVNFPEEENGHEQIIGYGGQECFESDAEDETDRQQDDADDDIPFTEEERQIHNQTQKNTSFNSVSRNLLAAEVATFKNHGVSADSSARTQTTSAPLVTIRPFGQPSSYQAPRMKVNGTSSSSDCPKVNLVSPMRNGQVLTGRNVTNQPTNNKEEMKNRENLLKKTEPLSDVKKSETNAEKITSFSDPVPIKILNEPIKEQQQQQQAKVAPTTAATTTISTPSSTTITAVTSTLAATVTTTSTTTSSSTVSNSKAMVLQSSKVASGRIEPESSKPASSNRITLSRKPPVWREKPRIPIKPQTTANLQTIEPIPSALYPPQKVDPEPIQQRQQQPQMKAQKSDSQLGQISVRFVHLSSGDDSARSAVVPPLLPANNNNSNAAVEKPQAAKELSALQRLDLLESSEPSKLSASVAPLSERRSPSPKVPELHLTPPKQSPESPAAAEVVVSSPKSINTASAASPIIVVATEINNNPPIKVVQEQSFQPRESLDQQPRSPKFTISAAADDVKESPKPDCFSSECRSSSTRGLTRSAFEALRANLAGTLELSRVCQPQRSSVNNTKRQAPPTPLSRDANESSTDPESLPPAPPTPVISAATPTPSTPSASPMPPPIPPALPPTASSLETPPAKMDSPPPAARETPKDRTLPVANSSRYRNSFICTSPDGSSVSNEEFEPQPRSVSLTRVERTDSQSMSTKPSSIRKILKERATHFLNMADGSANCGSSRPSGSRLSRSDRFVAEAGGTISGKKSKGRFSLRKLLGLKKEGEWDEPVEPLPPKIRPEIVHPIDFHTIGQVEVVAGKVDTTIDSVLMGRSPAHDSISSTDSGRPSSAELQRSDSSLGSSDCPSPANSHQSSSFKNASIKGRPKPPPPPRIHSLDQPSGGPTYRSTVSPITRPVRPPPPKSGVESVPHDANRFSPSPVLNNRNSEYANLGDIRNGITPKKPERSASMRTREVSTTYESLPADSKQDGLHYDCVSIQQPSPLNKPSADEDGYIIPMRMKSSPSFSSSSSASSIQRHSLTSFQPTPERVTRRSSRPGLRQSRQDLHVKLEDHYGTVTGANFQALAQLLEQATSKRPLAPHFHELRRVNSRDLKWNVFGDHSVLLRTATVTVAQSTWQNHDLLLAIYNDASQDAADYKAPFAQPAVINFTGQVPSSLLPMPATKAGIEVFPPGQVATLKQLPHLLAMEMEVETERLQHSLSVILQTCRALEWLVQQKRLTNRLNHEEIVFYRENSQDAYRLLWLPQEVEPSGLSSVKETLSSCIRLLAPLLSTQLADKLLSIIQRDGPNVDRMCQFLEFTMFGPATDLIDGDPDPMDMFQRWLDVERASALNELIRTQGLWRVKLPIIEEFRLSFLVSTSPHHLLNTSQI